MEKAIDIKRRAQRCIQNGDLDGALNEYEKLVGSGDTDPYNYVLLADLLYKKGDPSGASERYLSAVSEYEHASLYKNAIAVCKKMLRLALSPAKVLQALGNLHALDGLAGEAALYYVQYAEHMVSAGDPGEAAMALRQAFDVCQDNLRVLEQLSEASLLSSQPDKAREALLEAAKLYRERGSEADARRCEERAGHIDPGPVSVAAANPAPASAPPDDTAPFAMAPVPSPAAAPAPPAPRVQEPADTAVPRAGSGLSPVSEVTAAPLPTEIQRMPGFETGRHEPAWPSRALIPSEVGSPASGLAATPGSPQADPPEVSHPLPASEDVVIVDRDDAAAEYVIEDEPATYEEIASEAGVSADPAETEPAYELEAYEVLSLDESPAGNDSGAPAGEIVDDVISLDDGTEEEDPADPVYEISADELISFDAQSAEESGQDAVYEISDDELAAPGTSPQAPGLSFKSAGPGGDHAAVPEGDALAEVEALLAAAQEQFRAGDRDGASGTLTHAAQAYESLDRHENAAAIYRSLGKGAHATSQILELWLGNCERRHDRTEAAAVACDLGDRALNDGDEKRAIVWFERATALDGDNETARRRMERLAPARAQAGEPVALATAAAVTPPQPPAPPPLASQPPAPQPPAPQPAAPQDQRVEIAVGRAEAVSFDLAGLLAEFQRGVEAQLAGDAQSHYDLGMTYREMGLHEQALDSFRTAEQDPRFTVRAAEMSARCLAEQGRHSEAAGEFQRALALPGITQENDIELRYHFANSLVELGRFEEALPEFELVEHRMPEFEDIGDRLDALRRTLGRG